MSGASSKEKVTTKGFAELLDELPAEADAVTLVGVVTRCSKEGHFRFMSQGGGRPIELPVEAVRRHCVLYRDQGHLLVQLEAERAMVDHLLDGQWENTYRNLSYVPRTNSLEVDLIRQKFHADPIDAGPAFATGYAPFVLATPHHAPPGPLAMQTGGPMWIRSSYTYADPPPPPSPPGVRIKSPFEAAKGAPKDGNTEVLQPFGNAGYGYGAPPQGVNVSYPDPYQGVTAGYGGHY
jgi:hypothetical protein